MRPAHRSSRVGQDRWLLSYADVVTLLLLFFVTLYGLASVNADGTPHVSSALRVALGPAEPPDGTPDAARLVASPAVVAKASSLDGIRLHLTAVFAEALQEGRIEVSRDARGLVLSLPEEATFDSASAEVTPQAGALIAQVAEELGPFPHPLRIEGHTDDLPVMAGRYRSNWELSTARAGSVVAFLIEQAGLAPGRLSAAGYAEFHPRVPNDSPAHRARNRRVDIVVVESPAS